MAERKKSNLQHLKDLTETLCGESLQSTVCEKELFDTLHPLQKDVADLNEVLEAVKEISKEYVLLKAEITKIKQQVTLMLKENE